MNQLSLAITSVADDGQLKQLKVKSKDGQKSEQLAIAKKLMLKSYATYPALTLDMEAQIYQADQLLQSDDDLAN